MDYSEIQRYYHQHDRIHTGFFNNKDPNENPDKIEEYVKFLQDQPICDI